MIGMLDGQRETVLKHIILPPNWRDVLIDLYL